MDRFCKAERTDRVAASAGGFQRFGHHVQRSNAQAVISCSQVSVDGGKQPTVEHLLLFRAAAPAQDQRKARVFGPVIPLIALSDGRSHPAHRIRHISGCAALLGGRKHLLDCPLARGMNTADCTCRRFRAPEQAFAKKGHFIGPLTRQSLRGITGFKNFSRPCTRVGHAICYALLGKAGVRFDVERERLALRLREAGALTRGIGCVEEGLQIGTVEVDVLGQNEPTIRYFAIGMCETNSGNNKQTGESQRTHEKPFRTIGPC